MTLKEGERLDDLQCHGFRILQNPSFFCFGVDAVLLSGFAFSGTRTGRKEKVMDFCTGNGIIPLLLVAKEKASFVTGMEIQMPVADMAERSVRLNHAEDRICIYGGERGDVRETQRFFDAGSFDAVTCNPPYISENRGLENPETVRNIARHERTCTLEDVVRNAGYLLKQGGSFVMVHRPFRLPEIFETMRRHQIEPKRMQLVQPTARKEPNLVLIEGIRMGKPELKCLPTLVVYEEDGEYTNAVLKIYGKMGI